jgi:hypothetical protein
MHIRARLDDADMRRVLGEILPVTVLFDEDQGLDGRWVTIDRARELEMVPGEGIRLATSGELRWPVSVVPVTIRLTALQVLLRPIVVGQGVGTRLLFRPLIEEADLQRLPGFVDRGIVAIVNRALEARSELLAWRVADSLGLQFQLPATLGPLETANVEVVSAGIEIDERWMELSVSLQMSVSRLSGAPLPPAGGSQRRPRIGLVPP